MKNMLLKGMTFVLAVSLAACGGGGSSSTPAATGGVPSAPASVAAVCGDQKITVSWPAAAGASSYKVYRSISSGATGTLAGTSTTTSYVDTSGTVGATYYYTVKSVNSSGESAASPEVSETFYKLLAGAMQGKSLSLTGTVTTFAGSSGFSGLVNGVGSAARFSLPQGMATDGNYLYVADYLNNAIRKIDPATQAVSLFAGSATGSSGYADGIGTVARFFRPYDITSDGANLFVTEFNGCVIRKIDIATANVTTLAGTGVCSYPSTDGTGTAATFDSPQGITTDGTYLYVTENTVVRRIHIATQVVTKFAGDIAANVGHVDGVGTAARFNNLEGITTDGTSLFVLDQYYNDIRKIEIASANVTTYAGSYTAVPAGSADGTGTGATFNKPFGITTDGTNLYVVEQYGDVVRKINIASAAVTTLAGTPNTTVPGNPGITGTADGVGAAARFSAPQGITTYCGKLFIGDTGNSSIRRIQ